ncbi:DUF998 domain-containing protein [Kineococcus rhizosphaerae]|uniref:Uncharacterized protein DUF998 n=1 Tax=Kineococcus rhizosphaerae TaxID=559628 RepID=A0A2T0R5D0_9ACTN|nr:DUF998 domain-containing protein [Kineococcus rhizosphaerae]PRY15925.1 uncharacterized protein DUF998 [Kineococcus rhizosphaerae]
MRRAAHPGWLPVAVVAALANANFLLAPFVGARVDLAVGVISELSVPTEPGSIWFRLGDGSAGLLTALLALPLWRSGPRHARFRAVCLAVFGLGTFVSALVPVTCAPSLGPCPASSVGAELVHDGVSVLGTAAAVLAGAELVWRTSGVLRALALLVALVSTGCGLYEVVTFFQGGNGGGGDSQRWQVLAVSSWIVLEVVSWGTLHRRRAPSR